jgi:hypothetical protein
LTFNSAAPGVILSTQPLLGLQAGQGIEAIDFRPATGQLYGLGVGGTSGLIVIIDPTTGQLTPVCQPFPLSAPIGSGFDIDFDPTSGFLRVTDSQRDNLLFNPDTGAIMSEPRLSSVGIVGAAFDDNIPGAATTTLFAINTATDSLVREAPTGSGSLQTVGPLGVAPLPQVGFDIAADGTAFATLTTGAQSGLYTINLASGAATLIGPIGSSQLLGGMAVVPAVVQFSAPAYAGPEGSGVTVTVTRLYNTLGTVTVNYGAVPGTATAGTDFLPVSGTLTFAPGEKVKTFTVPLLPDPFVEGNETVLLGLRGPTGGALLGPPNTAVLTILDAPTLAVTDVTPLVSVRVGPTRFISATGRYRRRVTLRNMGTDVIRGPLELVLDNLPRKVRLWRPTGLNQALPPLGSPFRDLVLPGNVFKPGQVVTLDLDFINPLRRPLRFTTRVLAR